MGHTLLDSASGLEASRPGPEELLMSRPDDELSGSDAEGTPRCVHMTLPSHWRLLSVQ